MRVWDVAVPVNACSQGSQVVRRKLITTLLTLVVLALLASCSAGDVSGSRDDGPVSEQQATAVEVLGAELVLVAADGSARTLATLDPDEDGEFVHAALRPGERGTATVLALTRSPDTDGSRYELRYLVADDEGQTDLYWFPWRLQVVEDLAAVLDQPPLPIWSPDGSSVAWVEWDGEGTRLRTVAWRDDGHTSNPSDDASAYQLEGVPPGTQLESWEVGSDGVPVLRGLEGETIWRIRLDVGRRAIAMSEPG
jgi:hypothetical protein